MTVEADPGETRTQAKGQSLGPPEAGGARKGHPFQVSQGQEAADAWILASRTARR